MKKLVFTCVIVLFAFSLFAAAEQEAESSKERSGQMCGERLAERICRGLSLAGLKSRSRL